MWRKPYSSGKRRWTLDFPKQTQVVGGCSDALPSQPAALGCLTLPNESPLPPNSSATPRMLILPTTGCMKNLLMALGNLWENKRGRSWHLVYVDPSSERTGHTQWSLERYSWTVRNPSAGGSNSKGYGHTTSAVTSGGGEGNTTDSGTNDIVRTSLSAAGLVLS